jgi:AmmeMemoRadiSam system protein B
VLGPSHTYYLPGCALTTFQHYATPFGDLEVDEEVISELRKTGEFSKMPRSNDVEEHSLEMHLPYLWKRLEQTHSGDKEKFPPIVPILVGSNEGEDEKLYGRILLPYLQDSTNAFIISSDFCHWGSHFRYQVYFSKAAAERRKEKMEAMAADKKEAKKADTVAVDPATGAILVSVTKTPRGAGDEQIHESIAKLDKQAMDAIETGVHDNFVENLQLTGNTVCGRHPIGVMMAALEELNQTIEEQENKAIFKFVQYRRSNDEVTQARESSVSYASAYAIA